MTREKARQALCDRARILHLEKVPKTG